MSVISKIKVGGTIYDVNPTYPVGSIYLSVSSTSPAELFGGTWEQIKDRFMLACGNTYAAGSTGGEEKHILTKAEMPEHSHKAGGDATTAPHGELFNTWTMINLKSTRDNPGRYYTVVTAASGENQPHNNMPPYVAVYAWKRIA